MSRISEFMQRTAVLMVRLENRRQHNRPQYRWLALAHQQAAAGVAPGEGQWKELERLEGLSKPEAPPCV